VAFFCARRPLPLRFYFLSSFFFAREQVRNAYILQCVDRGEAGDEERAEAAAQLAAAVECGEDGIGALRLSLSALILCA